MPNTNSRAFAFTLLAGPILALTLAGVPSCAGGAGAEAVSFPVGDRRAEVLDIQVLREGTNIRMTNATALPLGPGRLWLNEWYSHPVESFAPGQTVVLPISRFIDEAGVRMEAGGFFATKSPTPIVAAHFEQDDLLYGFIVVASRPE